MLFIPFVHFRKTAFGVPPCHSYFSVFSFILSPAFSTLSPAFSTALSIFSPAFSAGPFFSQDARENTSRRPQTSKSAFLINVIVTPPLYYFSSLSWSLYQGRHITPVSSDTMKNDLFTFY